MTNATDRCVNPAEMTPDGILAFALGEAGPEIRRHVERCRACRIQAEFYGRASNLLTNKLLRASCLSSMRIGEYVLGTLQGVELRETAEHLADCPHCLAESQAMRRFLQEPDEPVSQSLLERLFLRPLSTPAPAMAGLRGAGVAETVTYVDASDRCHISVSVQANTPGRRGKVIAGLLEHRSGLLAGKVASLFEGSRLLQTDNVDDLGCFMFNDVLNGTYRIEVNTDDAVAVIEDVEVT